MTVQLDRNAAVRQALAAYTQRQQLQQKAPPQPKAQAEASFKAFVAETSRQTGLSAQELTALFKAHDRGERPPLDDADLDQVLEASRRYMATQPPEENKGWLSRAAGWVTHKVGEAADQGLDLLGDAAKVVVETEAHLAAKALKAVGADETAAAVTTVGDSAAAMLDGTLDRIGNAAGAVLEVTGTYMEKGTAAAADEMAEKTLGPQKPAYRNQVPGVVGAFTNRLDAGENVFVSLGGKVTLPSEALGFPNVEGGVKVAASLKRSLDGKIQLIVSGEAAGSASYEASAKVKANLTVLGSQVVGVEAGVTAKAGLEASASAELTLSFDPNKPEDVARLRAILEPADSSAGNPGKLAINQGTALRDALQHNFGSVEVGGRFGASADAKAYAEAGAGGNSIGGELGASLKAGVGGSYKRDAEGNVTTRVRIDATFKANAGVYGDAGKLGQATLGANFKDDMDEAFSLTRDRNGKLTGLKIESSQVNSLGTKTEILSKSLSPQGLAEAEKLIAGGKSPYAAFRELEAKPGMLTFAKKTITRNEFTLLAANFEVALGAKAEVDVNLSVGRGKESVTAIDAAAYAAATHAQDQSTLKVGLSYSEAGKENPHTQKVDRAKIGVEYDTHKGTVEVTAQARRHVEGKATYNPHAKPGERALELQLSNKSYNPSAKDAVAKAQKLRQARIDGVRSAASNKLKLTVADIQSEHTRGGGPSGLQFTRFVAKAPPTAPEPAPAQDDKH